MPTPRHAMAIAVAIAILLIAGGCGGASTGSSGSKQILRVGSTYYIDSLNPFVAEDAQATNAFVMEYPQLVQYGPGLKLVGDWAKSWDAAADGSQITFHLIPGGKWSDGTPLTAQDAVWTIQTTLKYRSGPTAYLAGVLDGVSGASAPDPNTLVLTYDHPVAAALADLEQLFVLPEHVWSKHTGDNGKGLLSYFPEKDLPTVAGGAYTITKYQAKGTTVFKPNPYFYGPKSHVKAVALTYYTNPTTMIAEFQAGGEDFIDALPYTDADALKSHSDITVTDAPGSEVTNLGFNSNPAKPKNRELLDPRVKEAIEYAIPRQQLVSVLFGGHAKPWANIMSAWSGPSGWLNPDVKPLPFDPDKANQILDSLGYARGSNGVRVAPATSGQYAQGAHDMSYPVIVPNDLDFNGQRQIDILGAALDKIGIKIHEVPGGDAGQAWTMITAPHGTYQNADMYTWYWHPYIDPNYNLSVITKAQWNNSSDTGWDDPTYDAWYRQQQKETDFKKRQALVWKMEAYAAEHRPYIQLVNTDVLTAYHKGWTGFSPELWSYCKCYYTAPHGT